MVQMKDLWNFGIYNQMLLYIPHGSDESFHFIPHCISDRLNFISHMVQMKDKCDSDSPSHLSHLYIPHGSDESWRER